MQTVALALAVCSVEKDGQRRNVFRLHVTVYQEALAVFGHVVGKHISRGDRGAAANLEQRHRLPSRERRLAVDRDRHQHDCTQAGTGSYQGTVPEGINSKPEISGACIDGSNVYHGFVRASDGTVTDFDAPGSACIGTYAGGINSDGWITGYYFDAQCASHGYVRDPKGNLTRFDVKGAGKGQLEGTEAFTINDAGVISGVHFDQKNVGHGFVRDPWGNITTFDVPGAGKGSGQGPQDTFINDVGEVAGTYTDANNVSHGFLRLPF